jgi:hypothetical protein
MKAGRKTHITNTSAVAVTLSRLPTKSQLQNLIENQFVDPTFAGPTLFEGIDACSVSIKASIDVHMSDILHKSCHRIVSGNGGTRAAHQKLSQILALYGLLFDDET